MAAHLNKLSEKQIERYGLVGINNQTLDRIFTFKNFPLHFLKLQGLKPHHTVLEIGCGVLRSGTPIIDYLNEGNYSGFDVSKERIYEAYNELKECNLEYKKPKIYLSNNLDSANIHDTFDFIISSFTICCIDSEKLNRTFFTLQMYLKPTGLMFANVPAENENLLNTKARWKEFGLFHRYISEYKHIAKNNCLNIADIGPIENYGFNFIDGYNNKQRMLKFWK